MAVIQIENFTVIEKIQIMESLLDSLCAQPENISTPIWHSEVLEHREAMIDNQTDSFIDWTDAKENIRKQIS